MGRADLLEIRVGAEAAPEPQIGQFGQQIAGRGTGILHTVQINQPGRGQGSGRLLQAIGGHRLQHSLQGLPLGAHSLQRQVLHPIPGPEGEAPQMVKGALLSGLPSPQSPLESPVSPVAQPTDTSDHRGLAHTGRAGQLPNGQGLQLPGVGQEKGRHFLFRRPQGGIRPFDPVLP